LTENQNQIRIADFELVAVDTEIALESAIGSEDREPINSPYNGSAYYYVKVVDEDGNGVEKAQVRGRVGERESAGCGVSGQSGSAGIAQVKIPHSCLEEGSEVVLDEVNGESIEGIEISLGKEEKNRYLNIWEVEGRADAQGSFLGVPLNVGGIESGIWKANMKDGGEVVSNVPGTDARLEDLERVSREGRSLEGGPSSGVGFEIKTGEVIEAGVGAGADLTVEQAVRKKHSFNYMEDFNRNQSNVMTRLFLSDVRGALLPSPFARISVPEGGSGSENNYLESNYVSSGMDMEVEGKVGGRAAVNLLEDNNSPITGFGVELGGSVSLTKNYLRVRYLPRQSDKVKARLRSKVGGETETSLNYFAGEAGVSGRVDLTKELRAEFVNGDNLSGFTEIAGATATIDDFPFLNFSRKGPRDFSSYFEGNGEKPVNVSVQHSPRDGKLESATEEISFVENTERISTDIVDGSPDSDLVPYYYESSILIDNSLDVNRNRDLEGRINYKVVKKVSKITDGRTSISGKLGISGQVTYGPKSNLYTKNVREKGVFVDGTYYPLVQYPPPSGSPSLSDVLSPWLTEEWISDFQSSWNSFTDFVGQKVDEGKQLFLEWADESKDRVDAAVETGEETWSEVEGTLERCTSTYAEEEDIQEATVSCTVESASEIGEIGARYVPEGNFEVGGGDTFELSKQARSEAGETSASRVLSESTQNPVLRFEPYGIVLPDSGATIKLRIPEEYLQKNSLSVEDIRIFRKEVAGAEWTPMETSIGPDTTFLSATADTLTAFSVGRDVVSPRLKLTAETRAVPADGESTIQFDSSPKSVLDGSPISDTTRFTIRTSRGTVTAPDGNPERRGVQISPESGQLSFQVRSDSIPGTAKVSVLGPFDKVLETETIAFENTGPPSPPSSVSVQRMGGALKVSWEEVSAPDLSGYRVHFDSDDPEPPYNGTATVEGSPSPVEVGRDTSAILRGLDPDSTCYVSVTAYDIAESESDFPPAKTAPEARSERLQVNVTRSLGTDPGPQSYRLVALPGQVSRPLEATLSGEAGTEWQAYWDDGSEENFLVEYDGSDTFHFREGRGFWATSKSPWTVEDSVEAASLDPVEYSTSIPVHEGWNIISNPLGVDVAWSEVAGLNRDNLEGGSDLQPIWAFGGSFTRADTFSTGASGQAYYFLNDQGLDSLQIPYQAGSSGEKRPVIAGDSEGELLSLSATLRDSAQAPYSTVRVGIDKQASLGPGSDDIAAPPRQFETVSLRIESSDTSQSGRKNLLMTDRRPPVSASGKRKSGHVFDLNLESQTDGPVLISAEGFGAVEGREVALIDSEASETHDLRSEEFVVIDPKGEVRDLRLAVGTEAFVGDLEGKNLPAKVSLKSYPNPVDRQGTIEYTLPEQKKVTLQVYDVLGRRVATLAKGQKEAGRHQVRLDADRLASGVYFSRLQAGDDTHTQKIVVVR
jgi:hypothetical protein